MESISMKQALELEGIAVQGSWFDSWNNLIKSGWTVANVGLKTGYGDKTHRGRALIKDNNIVVASWLTCGSRKHYSHIMLVGIDAEITCDKCK